MPTAASAALRASDSVAQHQRLQACQRALHARGWKQRLAPLAKHMTDHSLVRRLGYDCAFQRHIDPHVLRDALARMLEQQWEDGYLIVQLLIEERDPALVARELGVSQGALHDMSRDALEDLGLICEDVAFGALGQSAKEQAQARKRRQ